MTSELEWPDNSVNKLGGSIARQIMLANDENAAIPHYVKNLARHNADRLSLARRSRVPATALGFAAVRIEKKMKGSQGMPGKVSVVEGSYWNDSMHDKDFSLSGGTE